MNAQTNSQSATNKNTSKEKRTILETESEKLDSNKGKNQKESALPDSETKYKYTAAQDSAYTLAMRLKLPTQTRLWYDLALTDKNWFLLMEQREQQPINRIIEQIASIPKEFLVPDAREVAQRDIAIQNSQYVPGVRTINNNGVKIPFSTIGSFLGLTEDVSPKINYSLDYQSNVEVVVYSVQAVVIASLFKGVQPVGKYTFNWNGRDDNGRPMPKGDYVAEVRVGNEKYIRKRIYIP